MDGYGFIKFSFGEVKAPSLRLNKSPKLSTWMSEKNNLEIKCPAGHATLKQGESLHEACLLSVPSDLRRDEWDVCFDPSGDKLFEKDIDVNVVSVLCLRAFYSASFQENIFR